MALSLDPTRGLCDACSYRATRACYAMSGTEDGYGGAIGYEKWESGGIAPKQPMWGLISDRLVPGQVAD
eukprot:1185-Rhodomonas_salina.1